jgi:hypothetical protein
VGHPGQAQHLRKRSTSDEPYMPFFKGDYEVTAYVPSISLSGQFGRL